MGCFLQLDQNLIFSFRQMTYTQYFYDIFTRPIIAISHCKGFCWILYTIYQVSNVRLIDSEWHCTSLIVFLTIACSCSLFVCLSIGKLAIKRTSISKPDIWLLPLWKITAHQICVLNIEIEDMRIENSHHFYHITFSTFSITGTFFWNKISHAHKATPLFSTCRLGDMPTSSSSLPWQYRLYHLRTLVAFIL